MTLSEEDFVPCRTCKLIHSNLEKLCDARHYELGLKVDRMVTALESFPRPEELREVLQQRSADRAWGLIGKIVCALAAIWIAAEKLLSMVLH